MGIVNTRNAVVGYAVVKGSKYALKSKAKESATKPRLGAWAAGTLAAAAFVTFKKRRKRRRTAAAAGTE
jgi:uncharacterized membrane protein YebE (DUF533 family)